MHTTILDIEKYLCHVLIFIAQRRNGGNKWLLLLKVLGGIKHPH